MGCCRKFEEFLFILLDFVQFFPFFIRQQIYLQFVSLSLQIFNFFQIFNFVNFFQFFFQFCPTFVLADVQFCPILSDFQSCPNLSISQFFPIFNFVKFLKKFVPRDYENFQSCFYYRVLRRVWPFCS